MSVLAPPRDAPPSGHSSLASPLTVCCPLPVNELQRQSALDRYRIVDSLPEREFDDLTLIVAQICQTPIALVSLIDHDRQWFKARVGLEATETPRNLAFCAHAILQPEDVLLVPNALEDERFAHNPLVTGDPHIRFYVGAPLVTHDGYALGTLCAIDRQPRQLSEAQIAALTALARQVVAQLELRDRTRKLERQITQRQRVEAALRQEKQRSETLLYSILPSRIAHRLKREKGAIAEGIEEATVLFADLANFTRWAARLSPHGVVSLLDRLFSHFDALTQAHGVEKIKTIGDSYMVAGGLGGESLAGAIAVCDLALAMQLAVYAFDWGGMEPLQLRIGLHLGPAVAGVIGATKPTYDLWGDTVNLASRMESHGLAGRIHVSEAVYFKLRQHFQFEKRGEVLIKGKGETMTYWLGDRRPNGERTVHANFAQAVRPVQN